MDKLCELALALEVETYNLVSFHRRDDVRMDSTGIQCRNCLQYTVCGLHRDIHFQLLHFQILPRRRDGLARSEVLQNSNQSDAIRTVVKRKGGSSVVDTIDRLNASEGSNDKQKEDKDISIVSSL